MSQWEIYIIESETGKFYTGITNDFDRRLEDHIRGKKGAKFFRFSSPKSVVFRESHPSRSEASKREAEIKKMTRAQKLALIQNSPSL